MILDSINKANDIKEIEPSQYEALAKEIRAFLLDKISVTGGHLASNLGVVELTMALHLSLNFPEDKIVWDVEHQAYTHKILSGRKEEFDKLRIYGGISGFPKRRESKCDCFDTGHSSTSISAALGIVNGNQINHSDSHVVAVIGDGALTGGMAFEALNNAANLKRNFIIILNDNEMSISENVGGMSRYLSKIRAGSRYNDLKNGVVKALSKLPGIGENVIRGIKKAKSGVKQFVIPGMLFENMGITYLGPVDGHNIKEMQKIIGEAKNLDHPVLIHILTKKGKGYKLAENYPASFHGVAPFDKRTGLPYHKKVKSSYTDIVARGLVKLGRKYPSIVAITAAMPEGTGLNLFKKEFPNRFFDVGIAEEHAVTFAAGLSTTGLKPYVAIYSSFLQRAYDQILHDVCIQNLPVVFLIDRAGLVGGDGETHQGVFDISFLSSIPNMHIVAPKNKYELYDILRFSVFFDFPLAIRYPRGEAYSGLSEFREPIQFGKSEILYKEKDIVLFAIGNMVKTAVLVRQILKEKGFCVTLVNARFIKPIDEACIDELADTHNLFVTMEENVKNGSCGERVLSYIHSRQYEMDVLNISVPNIYVEHGDLEILQKETGIDVDTIVKKIIEKKEQKQ